MANHKMRLLFVIGFFAVVLGLMQRECNALPNCDRGVGDTDKCETCAEFAGLNRWSPTTGRKHIEQHAVGLKPAIEGYYKCDDYSSCNSTTDEWSTQLCGRVDCVIDSHCTDGKVCSSGGACVVPASTVVYAKVMKVNCPGAGGELNIAGFPELSGPGGETSKVKIGIGISGSAYGISLVNETDAANASCVHVAVTNAAGTLENKAFRKCTATNCS